MLPVLQDFEAMARMTWRIGRNEDGFSWEKTDKAEALRAGAGI